jgi:oligopeptide/dipeptide ABC transporter ATP-binding protein
LLLDAAPVPDPTYRGPDIAATEQVPTAIGPAHGCPFVDRCPKAMAVCRTTVPAATLVGPGHYAACHLYA